MLSHTKYLTVKVPERMDFLNITGEVEKAVKESRVREGLCLVNAMHITASVFINDDEPGLHEDYKRWLEWLAPFDASPKPSGHHRHSRRQSLCMRGPSRLAIALRSDKIVDQEDTHAGSTESQRGGREFY